MTLPYVTPPVARGARAGNSTLRSEAAGVAPSNCSTYQGIKCGLEGAALVAGPCDPALLPEGLAVCLPAAAAYVGNCGDCLQGAAKTAICGFVSFAQSHGISVPSVVANMCS